MKLALVTLIVVTTSALALAVEPDDYRARIEWAHGLGEGGAEAVPDLLRYLSDEEPVVRATAVASLGRIGPDASAAIPALLRALDDSVLRCAAAKALARIAPDRGDVATGVTGLLSSRSDTVREEGIRALAAMGETAVPPLLALRASREANRFARAAAGRAFLRLGRGAVPGLIRTLASADRTVRWSAILTLGDLGSVAEDAAPSLLAAAEGADTWNAVWARCSLVLVTGEVEPHLTEIRKDLSTGDVWGAAVQAIVRLGPLAGAAAPDLLKMLDEEDRSRRYQAAVALGSLGAAGGAALDDLTRRDRRSPDPDRYVRAAIRAAIEKLSAVR